MEFIGFHDGPVKPGPVDPIKGGFFAWEELQGLGPDVGHHLFSLLQGEATGPNFSQGQVHQKAQVSQVTVLFPDGVPPGDIIALGQRILPHIESSERV
jgi:hypothetical protein